MKKIFLLGAMVCALGMSVSAQNFYTMTFDMDGDTLRIATWLHDDSEYRGNDYVLLSQSAEILTVDDDDTVPYRRKGDSIFLLEHHDTVRFVYTLPASDYRTADGAIVLRREGNWYPHRNNELLTATVHIEAKDHYLIGGTVLTPSYELHLILLPKDKYTCKVMGSPMRPFHFYRAISDTTSYPDAFYSEFIDSYQFYCTFFDDSLSQKPMNIVEIGDPDFVMCQSLRDMIIFGHYFYDVYAMMPDYSWIPHEMAHQWWGNSLFFVYRDYALSESLNEYIKLQYLKSRGQGYKKQMKYYKSAMKLARKRLPFADIHNVESQDESIAIYYTAPYRLEKSGNAKVDALLQQLYHNHKHTVVTRKVFLLECKALKGWLMRK